MATPITVAQALTYEQNPSLIPPGAVFFISDTAANVEALTASQLANLPASRIDVSNLNGVGPLTLQDGYSYVVHGPVSAGEAISFADVGSVLSFDDTPHMAGTIFGFAPSDTIDLTDIAYSRNGSVDLLPNNVLAISENGHTYTLQLDTPQNFSGEFFHLAADAAGTGTDVVVNDSPCYCAGTLVETPDGDRRVEDLAIGDLVMTGSGAVRPIKWIGRRSFAGRFVLGRKDILPVCIKAGALGTNVPRRDLWISPHHAMYFERAYFEQAAGGGVLIEAKDLINGTSIVQASYVNAVDYFHIELDTHDVILAEGALSETFSDDDNRAMFHNADEFHALYPQAQAGVARYCAPRLDEGYEVAAVRRHIASALLASSVDGPSVEERYDVPIRGHVDEIGPGAVEGWAQQTNAPEIPVCLDIYADGRLVGQTLANLYREDLAAAGLGSGRHGFKFALPDGFASAGVTFEVRRSSDGARLPHAAHRAAAA
jgi:hypothetical protein